MNELFINFANKEPTMMIMFIIIGLIASFHFIFIMIDATKQHKMFQFAIVVFCFVYGMTFASFIEQLGF